MFLFFFPNLLAQGSTKTVDSLKSILQRNIADSTKVDVLFLLADEIPCEDSTGKIKNLNQALELAQKEKSAQLTMKSYSKLGYVYFRCFQNYQMAIEENVLFAQVAKQNGDVLNQAEAYSAIGLNYKAMNNYAKAIEYYNLELSLKPGPEKEMAAWGNMAVIYRNVGDNSKALSCYVRSLKILDQSIISKKATSTTDSVQMAGLLIGIGAIYSSMREYEKALDNYDKALKIAAGYDAARQFVFMAKGEAYSHLKNYVNAEDQYKNALALSRSIGGTNEGAILADLAAIYLKMGNPQLALKYANDALVIDEKLNQELQLSEIYVVLAKIFAWEKEYNHAVPYLKKAIQIAGKMGALDNEQEAWQTLSTTYEAMKKPAEAFDAYKHFITLRDSLYNTDKANELTRIDLESGFARKQLADSLGQVKQSKAYEMRIQRQKLLAMSGYCGLALVVLLSFFIYRNYSQQKKANAVISKANETIREEKQVSENLLLNILPEEVAKELKVQGAVQAKMFDNVTVLFTDFVNFTAAGERFTPQELVAELHACFKAFDEILGRYPIEKIKTVGDAYLAVSGLPNPDENHATEMVKAALEIRDFMVERRNKLGNSTFEIRIGVNSGTVVAGIVGVKKFAYDIWGDTVNTAARMEQYCEKGRVNISESTHELVKDKFTIVQRGKIAVKNKGELNMYFVEG